MRGRAHRTIWWAGWCFACAGCLPEGMGLGKKQEPPDRKVPADLVGTVGEFAAVTGGGSLLLDAHGLAVGLGRNGSADCPPPIRKYLVEYMLKQKLGSVMSGTQDLTPSALIADKDTAVIHMAAAIPPGAPQGWRFDVRVKALSQSGTRSLSGGRVYAFPLFISRGEGVPPTSGGRAWAMAEGSIFLNPFLDSAKSSDTPLLLEGRIIGGGKVLESRPLRLILHEPDYARCTLIQRRINERFGQADRIANARNPATIELDVPREYARDYERYLQLILHLPLVSEPGRWEARAREIAEEIVKPGANQEGLAFVWEAMGNQVLTVCRPLYASRNVGASFYAARTGLRLRDELAGDVLIRLATTVGSPFQVPAIQEVGRTTWFARSTAPLRQLIEDPSELVRIAAYEALVQLGDNSLVTRIDMGGEFYLDLVTSKRSYVIYASQSLERKIALFGRDMAVARRIFFNMPDDSLTMADKEVIVDPNGRLVADPSKLTPEERAACRRDARLMVFRTIPRTGGVSEPFYLDFSVRSLILALGESAEYGADNRIRGLNFTYGQIVAVLWRMCEVKKDIPAKFVLQALPGRERIYHGTATVGRPDMPGE